MWLFGIVGSAANRMDEKNVATLVGKVGVADGGCSVPGMGDRGVLVFLQSAVYVGSVQYSFRKAEWRSCGWL